MITFYTDDKKPSELLPVRNPSGHKGSFGKLLVIAGSVNMCGAALLAGKSAYRTGAGMVKILSHPDNRIIVQLGLPEALCGSILQSDTEWKNDFGWADALLFGPGIGTSRLAYDVMKKVLEQFQGAMVIDADGLNLLSKHSDLQQLLQLRTTDESRGPVILTPHMGELLRLGSVSGENISKDERIAISHILCKKYGVTLVSKDASTMVFSSDHPDKVFYINGMNSALATAGSGDVLAGCIASLLVQGDSSLEAAKNGVMLHAFAGKLLAEKMGEHAVMAGDLPDAIGRDML